MQFYLRDPAARRARPMKELMGFERVTLAAGESTRVSFDITEEILSYWTPEDDWHVEPGVFELMIGLSSEQLSRRRWSGMDVKVSSTVDSFAQNCLLY